MKPHRSLAKAVLHGAEGEVKAVFGSVAENIGWQDAVAWRGVAEAVVSRLTQDDRLSVSTCTRGMDCLRRMRFSVARDVRDRLCRRVLPEVPSLTPTETAHVVNFMAHTRYTECSNIPEVANPHPAIVPTLITSLATLSTDPTPLIPHLSRSTAHLDAPSFKAVCIALSNLKKTTELRHLGGILTASPTAATDLTTQHTILSLVTIFRRLDLPQVMSTLAWRAAVIPPRKAEDMNGVLFQLSLSTLTLENIWVREVFWSYLSRMRGSLEELPAREKATLAWAVAVMLTKSKQPDLEHQSREVPHKVGCSWGPVDDLLWTSLSGDILLEAGSQVFASVEPDDTCSIPSFVGRRAPEDTNLSAASFWNTLQRECVLGKAGGDLDGYMVFIGRLCVASAFEGRFFDDSEARRVWFAAAVLECPVSADVLAFANYNHETLSRLAWSCTVLQEYTIVERIAACVAKKSGMSFDCASRWVAVGTSLRKVGRYEGDVVSVLASVAKLWGSGKVVFRRQSQLAMVIKEIPVLVQDLKAAGVESAVLRCLKVQDTSPVFLIDVAAALLASGHTSLHAYRIIVSRVTTRCKQQADLSFEDLGRLLSVMRSIWPRRLNLTEPETATEKSLATLHELHAPLPFVIDADVRELKEQFARMV